MRPPHYWTFCVWNMFNWESKENWDDRYKGQQKRQISLAVEYPGIPQTIHWESVGRDRRSFATCCFVAWFNSTPIQHKMSTKKAAKSILWHPPNHSLRITGSRQKKFCHRFFVVWLTYTPNIWRSTKSILALTQEYPGIIHWESVGRDKRSFATGCFVVWLNLHCTMYSVQYPT